MSISLRSKRQLVRSGFPGVWKLSMTCAAYGDYSDTMTQA